LGRGEYLTNKETNTMTMLTNPTQINQFRYMTILRGLGLEIKGLKVSRGMTMYALIKKELGLKGTRESVYNELANMLGKPTI
jgi:hypothetical protein